MRVYRLSPAARADLDGIWDYTEQNWGRTQAERYINEIRAACEALVSGARQGRSAEAIRKGYFKLAVGSHFLFYRLASDGAVDVVRILHQRMDVPTHLNR